MEYRTVVTVSRYEGEDADGEAVYETHDHLAYSNPLTTERAYTVDGAQRIGRHFVAFPALVAVAVGDSIEVDGEDMTVLSVGVVRRPQNGQVVHTEVIGG